MRDTKEVFDGNGIMRHTFNNKCRKEDEMQNGHLNKSLDHFFFLSLDLVRVQQCRTCWGDQ